MIAGHGTTDAFKPYNPNNPEELMAPQSIGSTGGGVAIQHRSPYLSVSFSMALQGLYPSRS